MATPPTRADLNSDWLQMDGATPTGPWATQANQAVKEIDWAALFAPAQGPEEIGRLAHYRILRPLGAGGMGLVFLAEDTQLQRQVAIKIVRPDSTDIEAKNRILQEARALASIRNDHVVTIHHVGEERDILFLAMEFLPGESLEGWLEKHPRPSLEEILLIARETALGLAAAHELNLVHRDIKPGNLWVEPRPELVRAPGESGTSPPPPPPFRIKLLDFGLVKKAQESLRHTKPGSIVGTPHYIAPEQAQGAKPNAASDLYSYGVVLYRLCTGRLPFPQEDLFSLMTALATQQPPAVRELAPHLPAALADLVMRLLAKNPADRPPSALAVVDTLNAIARGEPNPPVFPTVPPTPRRLPVLTLAAMAGVCACALLAVWFVLHHAAANIAPSATAPQVNPNAPEAAWPLPSPPAELLQPPPTHVAGLEVVGHKEYPRLLRESSALVKSMRHPGVYWTLNDHLNAPHLYALEASGKLRAIVNIKGAENDDWESLTTDGAGNLYIGDTGNNDRVRTQGCIYRIREPDLPATPPTPGTVSNEAPVDAVYHYSFPGRPFDCEAIFFRQGEIYLFNLNRARVRLKDPLILYRLRLDHPQEALPLEPVCRLPDYLGEVRDASLSPDGRRLALCNSQRVTLYEVNPDAPLTSLATQVPRLFTYPHAISRRFEGCAWDGDGLMLIAEQTTEIFRVTFPAR